MPIGSKPKKKPVPKPSRTKGGVIDSRQRELAEEENQLQAKIAALQRTIAEAPARQAAQTRVDRDALISTSRGYHLHSIVPDSRYGQGNSAPVRRAGPGPMLRREKIAARQQTLALVVVLAVAVFWMLSHFMG